MLALFILMRSLMEMLKGLPSGKRSVMVWVYPFSSGKKPVKLEDTWAIVMLLVAVMLMGAVKFWNIAEPIGVETLNEGA